MCTASHDSVHRCMCSDVCGRVRCQEGFKEYDIQAPNGSCRPRLYQQDKNQWCSEMTCQAAWCTGKKHRFHGFLAWLSLSPVTTTSVTWESNTKDLSLSFLTCKMRWCLYVQWTLERLQKESHESTRHVPRCGYGIPQPLCSFPSMSPHIQQTHSANQRKTLPYEMVHNLSAEATKRLSTSPSRQRALSQEVTTGIIL